MHQLERKIRFSSFFPGLRGASGSLVGPPVKQPTCLQGEKQEKGDTGLSCETG